MNRTWLFWVSLVVMLGAFCFQFYEDFGNLLKRWNSEDFSYCYLVPFIFIYLIYTSRHSLADGELRSSGWGFVVLLLAGFVYLGGKLGSVETFAYMAIWFAAVGMALLAAGFGAVRTFVFPFLILAFIVPLPSFLNQLFTFKLKLISSALSVNMMRAAGLSVFREGNIIDLGVTQLQVVDACSGLRYVYPLVLMGLIFAYLFHKKWWERIVIIAATIPISVLSNAIRIAITGYLTLKVSPEAAEGFFHGFSGWLIFMVSFVFLAILSRLLKIVRTRVLRQVPVRVEKKDGQPFTLGLENTRPVYLWIAAALFVGFWGVHGALASGQIKPERKPFELFPTEIGDWAGEKSYLQQEILDSLWADDYIQIQLRDRVRGDALLLFVPYYEYQGTRHTAHSPVACIVGGGGFAPRSSRTLTREFPAPFGKVRIKQMVFEKGNEFLLSNYWFGQRGRIVVNEYWNKWYMFFDSITKRRTDGALVRIEMVVRPGQTVDEAQAVMDGFTMELMKILPEYVPN
jgi:exosortase D (VPLPA-CTERM-specific)